MTSELVVLNVRNYFENTSPEYFNVYSEIGASRDASPKTEVFK